MLVSVQIISKVIISQDYSIIDDNMLTDKLFPGYEKEFNFIVDHYARYDKVPDELTFRDKFPEFTIVEVSESDDYLIATIREEHLYTQLVPAIQEAASLLKEDSNAAVELLLNKLTTDELQPVYELHDEEIIATAHERVAHSEDINNNASTWFIPTGFDEIDADTNGFQRGDELCVLYARTNMGKSWVAEAMATFSTETGLKTGYFSPEMSVMAIGYRFDTLHGHMPNKEISFGRFDESFTLEDYANYANSVQELTGKLYVTKPKDFARKVTVSKLRKWIKQRHLDILFIDGITYLTDERYKRGDSKTVSLTNISEDLMGLSEEMKIPIVVVVQANRGGAVDKDSLDTPELETIRDSDGIAQNASQVFAIRQLRDAQGNVVLMLATKKLRIGEVGKEYTYRWDINEGRFDYVDEVTVQKKSEQKASNKISVSKHSNKTVAEEEDAF